MTFWNNTHPKQELYNVLFDELVPSEGKAATLAGEVLRASSEIYYDYYNNASCNNMTGAFDFLMEHLGVNTGNFKEVRDAVFYGNVNFKNTSQTQEFENLAELAIDFASKPENKILSEECMWDWGLDDREFDDIRGYNDCLECGYHEDDCECQ